MLLLRNRDAMSLERGDIHIGPTMGIGTQELDEACHRCVVSVIYNGGDMNMPWVNTDLVRYSFASLMHSLL